MTVARSIAAVWVPERRIHFEHASMDAQPSTAFRFRDNTRSKGGSAGAEALCKACNDCKQTVKQVQEPPVMMGGEDLWRLWVGRTLGASVGLGK
jgi:hypothetical protein